MWPLSPTPDSSLSHFDQEYPLLCGEKEGAEGRRREYERAVGLGRQFAAAVGPRVLPLDQALDDNPAGDLSEILSLAARYEVFSLAIPHTFGGKGLSMLALGLFLEQVASECLGIASLLGTHGLALAVIGATGRLTHLMRLARLIVDEQRAGRPYLLCTAATEAEAGSDIEDERFVRHARFVSQAIVTREGYHLTGQKVFVSLGSLARTCVAIMPTDRTNPRETLSAFLVETHQPGFSVERVEHKLGQRACPAAQLCFDDCLVPHHNRLSRESLAGRTLDLVLGASRAIVAGFGSGAARGLFEQARRRAATKPSGEPSHIDSPRSRMLLGRMWENASLARTAYLEAVLSNSRYGLLSLMDHSLLRRLDRLIPSRFADSNAARQLLDSPVLDQEAERVLGRLTAAGIALSSAHGSAAKVTTSRLALQNCELAIELFGAEALREDSGFPKRLRDIRLLSIYEGTTELCQLDVAEKVLGSLVGGAS
jgi:acyl-CoA dehydrogenase